MFIQLGTVKCLVFPHVLIYSCAASVDDRSVSRGEGGLLSSQSVWWSQATQR